MHGKILEIDELLVDKDKRRQGIGRALIDFAKKKASEKKRTIIQLNFAARNTQALKFYYTMGIDCLGMIQIFAPLSEKNRKRWYEEGKSTRFFGLRYYY